jgi:rhodanese-related sulfurtransferase
MIPAPVVALMFVAVIVIVDLTLGYFDILRVTEAQHLIDKGSPYIDVDAHDRFALSHPRGSVNMPYPFTVYLARHLDRSVPLVVHGHRFRSALAAHKLRKHGFQVLSLGSADV